MLRRDRWMVSAAALVIAGVASSGDMGGRAALAEEPAKLEEIPGSPLKRVVLTPKAAERLAIATEPVREEPVARWMMVNGEVEAAFAGEAGGGQAADKDADRDRKAVPGEGDRPEVEVRIDVDRDDRQVRHGLPRPRLAHDPQRLAPLQIEADAVHGPHGAVLRLEVRPQVSDRKKVAVVTHTF